MALKLTIAGVTAGYGAVRALENVSLDVSQGETVVLLGTNGNGKSTLMKCLMGLVRPSSGQITLETDSGRHDLTQLPTEEIVGLGVALVPEGRRLFSKLTVEENLMLGAYRARGACRRSRAISPSPTRRSRSWPNGAPNSPAPCPAASSRCWRSPVP